MGRIARALEALSLAAALGLVGLHVARVVSTPQLRSWRLLALIAAAWVVADLVSGLVHWLADTWGSTSMPVLGRRFLRPFRIHHENPADILERDFIDCNGDVAMLACPLLIAAWCLAPSSLSVFAAALGAAALPTNQVHQWAHQCAPPRPVRWLQERGLILSPETHARHHRDPHASHYCITNGWCNAPLEAIGLFRALERWITRATGRLPRSDA